MNLNDVAAAVKAVIKRHANGFRLIAGSQTKLLELASLTGIVEHYRSIGAVVTPINPRGKSAFVSKQGTRGHPWNFSRFNCSWNSQDFEIHLNLKVRGAHDSGIYCVDVGVVRADAVPSTSPATPWICASNEDLLSFAETKKLVVYPMLLAQFVGIVHEIMPGSLNIMGPYAHLPPTLITLGHFSGNSKSIVDNYSNRAFRILIAESYDVRLARVRAGTIASPFF